VGEMLCKFTRTETREQTGFKQGAGAARLFSEIWAEKNRDGGGDQSFRRGGCMARHSVPHESGMNGDWAGAAPHSMPSAPLYSRRRHAASRMLPRTATACHPALCASGWQHHGRASGERMGRISGNFCLPSFHVGPGTRATPEAPCGDHSMPQSARQSTPHPRSWPCTADERDRLLPRRQGAEGGSVNAADQQIRYLRERCIGGSGRENEGS